jgi:hypothetical protein
MNNIYLFIFTYMSMNNIYIFIHISQNTFILCNFLLISISASGTNQTYFLLTCLVWLGKNRQLYKLLLGNTFSQAIRSGPNIYLVEDRYE